MGKNNIGYGFRRNAQFGQSRNNRMASGFIVAEKFGRLLVAHSRINQQTVFALFKEQAAHSPGASIFQITVQHPVPNYLGNHSKHGTTIQF